MKKLSLKQEARPQMPCPSSISTGSFEQERVINGDSNNVGVYFIDMEKWPCHIFRRERLLLVCIQQVRPPGGRGRYTESPFIPFLVSLSIPVTLLQPGPPVSWCSFLRDPGPVSSGTLSATPHCPVVWPQPLPGAEPGLRLQQGAAGLWLWGWRPPPWLA